MKLQPHRLRNALAVALMCSSAAVAAQPATDNAGTDNTRYQGDQRDIVGLAAVNR